MSLGDMIDMDSRSRKREANEADFRLFISVRYIIARMEQIGEMGTGVWSVVVILVKRDDKYQIQVGKAYKVDFSFAVDVVGNAD